jgi:inorganic pyrophosphatase
VVETPQGSPVKYEFDPELGCFTVSKFLTLGLRFPVDFGFFPSTLADDGDPLDVLIVGDSPGFPGLVLAVGLVGVIEVAQHEDGRTVRNDRVIAVPADAERLDALTDAAALPTPLRDQVERFLAATDALQDKRLDFLGWRSASAARKLVEAAAAKAARGG